MTSTRRRRARSTLLRCAAVVTLAGLAGGLLSAPAAADTVEMRLPAGQWRLTAIFDLTGRAGQGASYEDVTAILREDNGDVDEIVLCGFYPNECTGGEARAATVPGGLVDARFSAVGQGGIPFQFNAYGPAGDQATADITAIGPHDWKLVWDVPVYAPLDPTPVTTDHPTLWLHAGPDTGPGPAAAGAGTATTTPPVAHRGDPVNTFSGNLFYQRTEVAVRDGATQLGLTRSYNSVDDVAGPFGRGWTSTFLQHLRFLPGATVAVLADGTQLPFSPDGNAFTAPPGVRAGLERDGTEYVLDHGDGSRSRYAANGALLSLSDRLGRQAVLARDLDGRLAAVHGGSQSLTFGYDSNGRIASVALDDGRTATYEYDANGLLAVARNPHGDEERYDYTDGRLAAVRDDADRVLLATTYDPFLGRVATQTDAEGYTSNYDLTSGGDAIQSFSTDASYVLGADRYQPVSGRLDSTSTGGSASLLGYDATGRLDQVVTTQGAATDSTELEYNAAGDIVRAVTPTATLTWSFDAEHRPLTSTDAYGRTSTSAYDASGRLTTVTGPDGGVTTLTYAGASRQPVGITEPGGGASTLAHDAAGNLTSHTDPDGNTTTFGYDASNRLVSVTDARGALPGADPADFTSTLAYDTADQITSVTDPAGGTTTYTYTSSGQVRTETDPLHRTTTYDYNTAGELVRTTRPDGTFTEQQYDQNGRLSAVVDPLGRVTSFQWDPATGRLLSKNLPGSGTARYTYDDRRRLVSETTPGGARTTYTYDAKSRVATVVTPNGNVTGADSRRWTSTYAYNAAGLVASITGSDGASVQYGYDQAGRRTSVTDQLGHTTLTEYDAAGRVAKVTEPTGAKTTYGYSPGGLLTTVKDPLNRVTTYGHDATGQVISVTTPQGYVTRYAYDALGRRTASVSPRAGADPAPWTTSYAYDAAGQLTGVTEPGGPTTTYGYDTVGRLTHRHDPLGRVTSYGYDDADRLLTVDDPTGAQTALEYDDADNVLRRVDGLGHATTWTYDSDGRMTSVAAPSGAKRTYAYDKQGNLLRTVGPAGTVAGATTAQVTAATTTYTYDAFDRVADVAYGQGATTSITMLNGLLNASLGVATPAVHYTYDAAGRLATVRDGAGLSTYTHDLAGRLTGVSGARSLAYTYDLAGQLTSRTNPDGTVATFLYDPDGRRFRQTVAGAVTGYEYDKASNLSKRILPSGVTELRAYDERDLLRLVSAEKSGVQLYRQDLTRDAVGNPLTNVRNDGTTVTTTGYRYDALDRLTGTCAGACTASGPTTASWSYDAAGNRTTETGPTSRAYAYDADSRLTTRTDTDGTDVAYTYDPNGNLVDARTRRPAVGALGQPSTVTTHRYLAYDAADRLAVSTDGTAAQRYAYDAFGRRSQRLDQLLTPAGPVTTRTTSLGWDELADRPQLLQETTAGAVQPARRYSWGPAGPDTVTATTDTAPRGYLLDALGSPVAVLASDGTAGRRYAYDPWGGVTATGTGPDDNPFRFAAGIADPDGHVNFQARDYDPAAGRFTQPDPLARTADQLDQAATSPYAYVRGRPLVLIDPLGLREHHDGRFGWLRTFARGAGDVLQRVTNFAVGFGEGVVNGATGVVNLISDGECAVYKWEGIPEECDGLMHIPALNWCPFNDGENEAACKVGQVTEFIVEIVIVADSVIKILKNGAGAIRRIIGELDNVEAHTRGRPPLPQGAPDEIPVRTPRVSNDVELRASESWGRPDTLEDHYLRHGGDFGATSSEDYARKASEFFQRAQRGGLPTKIDGDGIIRVYDPATNTFGAFNPDGTTRTFYTPKLGADYWLEQPGRLV